MPNWFLSDASMYIVQVGLEPIRLFLDLVRVLQDSLNLESPPSLLKSPSLYPVI